MDSQEEALNKITRISDPDWGKEPEQKWGTLSIEVDGKLETRRIPSAGDYRRYYEMIRDVLTGKSSTPPATPAEAWRTARVLEWAKQSSEEHRDIECDWSGEPA